MRNQIAEDIEMSRCIYEQIGRGNECNGKVEWEHAIMYAGRQLNEPWAIVGVCTYHHRGNGLNKNFNRFMAIRRADIEQVQAKYPKVDWWQVWNYLSKEFNSLGVKIN